ncbi:hypothetical protein ACIBG8_27375 [Nonomuraea sp. NPDC050556]|uniref:hypothetical protein n=1 Tax=Nonomuraea sp. NPDC050556 TaxID=3364369 RepID=UPI0037A06D6D
MQEVFERFGIQAQDSIYPYAPVFRGDGVVVKRTHGAEGMGRWTRRLAASGFPVVTPVRGPERIGDNDWVAYPWIDGRPYEVGDVAAAGDLLGRMHAESSADLEPFKWPDHDEASIQEDIDGLVKVLGTAGRLEPMLRNFMTTTLPVIRDADLPRTDVSMDFKAVNLVFTPDGPVLIDPDNGEHVPRLLDLALAVLLFHNDLETEPAKVFTAEEWAAFRDAYLARVELTAVERELWPVALDYMLMEWGVWSIVNGEWHIPRHAAFYTDLFHADLARFAL